MKGLVACIFLILAIASCKNPGEVDKSDPLISGRGFIEASLKEDYITAQKYLLADSTNMEYFERLKDFNSKLDPVTRRGYADANIIIDSKSAFALNNLSSTIVVSFALSRLGMPKTYKGAILPSIK